MVDLSKSFHKSAVGLVILLVTLVTLLTLLLLTLLLLHLGRWLAKILAPKSSSTVAHSDEKRYVES